MTTSADTQASAGPVGTTTSTRPFVVAGLTVGVLLGFSGNFFAPGPVQSLLYVVSAAGLICASLLLAVERAVSRNLLAAGGFALLALGETRVLNPTDVPGGEASFAVGVLLYAPSLVLIALSGWAPVWVRLLGAAAAVPFLAHSLLYLGGTAVDTAGPLASTGYGLFTLTVIGWILHVLRQPAKP